MLKNFSYIDLYNNGGYFGSYVKGLKGGDVPKFQNSGTIDYNDDGMSGGVDNMTSDGTYTRGPQLQQPKMSQFVIPNTTIDTSKTIPSMSKADPSLVGNYKPDATKPTTGSIAANSITKGLTGLLGTASSIYNANQLPTATQRSTAKGDAVESGVASALSAIPVWGTVAGAALNLVNGVGGSLMNNNSTAKAAAAFTTNSQVAQSGAYGGVAATASSDKQDGQAYRKAGLFGKLFTNTSNLKNEFSSSNIQQTQAANVLTTNKQAIQGSQQSADLFAANNQNQMYNSKMWNNGSVTSGKKGTKLEPIHIKKSHEGKFTEYKARTGESTEEALHSKDPYVRKMANFAKNAAKWKHQQGGNIHTPIVQQPAIAPPINLVKTPAPSMNSKKYLEGYNTAFDNNIQSKTLSQDLDAISDYAGKGSMYWNNDTMDYYKGQMNALQDLINQKAKLSAAKPVHSNQMGGKLGVPRPGAEIPRATMGTAPRAMNVQPQEIIQKVENKGDQHIDDNQSATLTLNGKDPNAPNLPQPGAPDFAVGQDVMSMISQALSAPDSSNAPVDPNSLPAMQDGGTFNTAGVPGTMSYNTLAGTLGSPAYKVPSKTKKPKKATPAVLKNGGVVNVIVDGHLHAHRHGMEDKPEFEDADITLKGVPVVTMDDGGEITQHAEVEKDELILHFDLTKQLEALCKENTDESMIEAGKLLAKEIVKNTKDSKSKIIKNS